jgi:hypothetical protein
MVLNRNPDNFFAETEQVAFCTAHVVPGIDFSNDPLLAGRIHSYVDTQITRLGGPNFHEIPINSPIAQVHNNQRDGFHRQAIHRGRVAYEPNSLAGGCPFQAGAAQGFVSFPARLQAQEDQLKVRGKPEKFADHYTQAKLFLDSQSPIEQTAHRERLPLRAEQGHGARHPAPRGLDAAQRERGAGHAAGRGPGHGRGARAMPLALPTFRQARGDDVARAVAVRAARRRLAGRAARWRSSSAPASRRFDAAGAGKRWSPKAPWPA